jgi:hypothetical protein
MTLHKITEFYTELFSVYSNITSKFRTIVIFKNCVKQNNDSNKTYRYVHDLLLYQSSKRNVSWVVSTKQTMNFNIQTAAMFVFFCFWQKWSYEKLFILWREISIQNFMAPRWLMQVLHPPQKFERPPFWNGWRYGIKKYGIEVSFNGMTSLLNFIKIYLLVQKLLGGTHR